MLHESEQKLANASPNLDEVTHRPWIVVEVNAQWLTTSGLLITGAITTLPAACANTITIKCSLAIYNSSLSSIDSFKHLKEIEGNLEVRSNNALTSISFDKLQGVSKLHIKDNVALISINGSKLHVVPISNKCQQMYDFLESIPQYYAHIYGLVFLQLFFFLIIISEWQWG